MWVWLGTTRWSVRVPGAAACGIMLMAVPGRMIGADLVIALTAEVTCFIGLLSAARFFGARVELVQAIGTLCYPPANSSRSQFSILEMVLWVAVAAELLGLVRLLHLNTDVPRRALEDAVFGCVGAVIGIPALWGALGTRVWPVRLGALIAAPALTALLIYWMSGGTMDDLGRLAILTGGQTMYMFGSLWIFRMYGYRLGRRV